MLLPPAALWVLPLEPRGPLQAPPPTLYPCLLHEVLFSCPSQTHPSGHLKPGRHSPPSLAGRREKPSVSILGRSTRQALSSSRGITEAVGGPVYLWEQVFDAQSPSRHLLMQILPWATISAGVAPELLCWGDRYGNGGAGP